MPESDYEGSGSIGPERLERILQRRALIWPPHTRERLESAEAATAARDEYAAPMWERYRRQAMEGRNGTLQDRRDKLFTSADADEQQAQARQQAGQGVAWGIIVLQRLAEAHSEETTGLELAELYPQGRHEELGEEWIISPTFTAVWEDSGQPHEVNGVNLFLSPPEDTMYAGDLSQAHFSIGKDETLQQSLEKRHRERRRFVQAQRELRRRADERRRHAELIGVVLEEDELEGEVLPWFIGRNGSNSASALPETPSASVDDGDAPREGSTGDSEGNADGEGTNEPAPISWREERDEKIRQSYPRLKARHGSAIALEMLSEEHNCSTRTVERALGWG